MKEKNGKIIMLAFTFEYEDLLALLPYSAAKQFSVLLSSWILLQVPT